MASAASNKPRSRGKSAKLAKSAPRQSPDASAVAEPLAGQVPWYRSTLAVAFYGGLLMWAAFPPLNLWPLAWIAPLPWLLLIRWPQLPGRRPLAALYGAGLAHWLLMVAWTRLPHWSAWFGWLALAGYLAVYVPLFIVLARTAVHRFRVPVVVAAPVVWVGLELVRGYMLTGFSLALLAHTQVDWPAMIQASDLGGAYVVSFVVMLVAAALAEAMPIAGSKTRRWPLAVAGLGLAAMLGYGQYRLSQPTTAGEGAPALRVGLIQGSIDTEFTDDPDVPKRTFAQYIDLSHEALRDDPQLDLLIWPESTFSQPQVLIDDNFQLPADFPGTRDELKARLQRMAQYFDNATHTIAGVRLKRPLLIGASTYHFSQTGERRYNTAVLLDDQGKPVAQYAKMHPVMFGEYVPLGEFFPWLYALTPMASGLTAGEEAKVFESRGLRLAPSICFENTVPQLIRRQIVALRRRGEEPDLLVTVTNDGWFWGSSLLDLHLTCGRFRAVEHRKPMLIAANTGFSAWIDGNGSLLAKGPRRAPAPVLAAGVTADPRSSLYTLWGDLPAAICLLLTLLWGAWGAWLLRRERQQRAAMVG